MARFIEFVKRLLSHSSNTEDRIVESFDKNVRFGSIACPSGRISFADPQYVHEPVPTKCVVQLVPGDIDFTGHVLGSPTSGWEVCTLSARVRGSAEPTVWRPAGEFMIDSAKVVVADSEELDDSWAYDGLDRMGLVVNVEGLARRLCREFGLRTAHEHVDGYMRIVEPVSKELEARIMAYIASTPKYAAYPPWSPIFKIKTNNSFDRVNSLSESWAILPLGNNPMPQMLVCSTGSGDGQYEVELGLSGPSPVAAKVVFIPRDESLS